MSSVNIDSTWREIEWWQDSTNDPDQKVRWRAIAKCEQDVDDNDSDVYFYVQRRITNAEKGWANYPTNKSMKITGTGASSDSHSATITWKFGYVTSTEWKDADGDYSDAYWSNVKHKSDGTLTIRAYITGDRVTSSSSIDTYVDLVLPTIPRTSSPSASKTSMTLNGTDSVTINTNRKSSSFTHTLAFTVGSNTVTVNNVGASYTWTPGVAYWMPYMRTKEETVTVTCTTYNGSTQIGSATCSFKLQIDTSVYTPVIGTTTTADVNNSTLELETSGTFILNASKLRVTANFTENTSDYGSALKSATVTCGDQSQTFTLSGQSGSIDHTFTNAITANTVIITVTDNWGVSKIKSITLTAINYSPIKLESVKIVRTNQSGVLSETGEYVTYTLTMKVYHGSLGQVNNTVTVRSRYKTPSNQTYTAWVVQYTDTNVPTTGGYGTYTISNKTTIDTYSAAGQFDIQFNIEDKLTNSTASPVRLFPGVPVFAWGEDYFDVYGSLHVHSRDDVMKYITFNADSVETVPVTFSGASGGSVDWVVFKFGKLRVATCRWRSANSYTCDSQWGALYYTPSISTPNFPVTFSSVSYQDIKYVGADNNATFTAFVIVGAQGSSGDISGTNMGNFALYRPDGGATIGHPVFTQIVIGTVA